MKQAWLLVESCCEVEVLVWLITAKQEYGPMSIVGWTLFRFHRVLLFSFLCVPLTQTATRSTTSASSFSPTWARCVRVCVFEPDGHDSAAQTHTTLHTIATETLNKMICDNAKDDVFISIMVESVCAECVCVCVCMCIQRLACFIKAQDPS